MTKIVTLFVRKNTLFNRNILILLKRKIIETMARCLHIYMHRHKRPGKYKGHKMIVVTVMNGGFKWYLKGTTWTSALERADKFDEVMVAMSAVVKAKKFMKPALFKSVQYESV